MKINLLLQFFNNLKYNLGFKKIIFEEEDNNAFIYGKKNNKEKPSKIFSPLAIIVVIAFSISLILEILAFLTFTLSILLTNDSVLATEIAKVGIHPQEWFIQALQWIDNLGSLGVIAFILLYIITTIALLPASIITLGAGVVFGLSLGIIYVFIGATIGAIFAFLIGRYLARDWVIKQIADNNKFKAIDRAVGENGLKIVLLSRLSPIFPFNILNYAYGVTGVSLKDYVIGSLGMLQGIIMYVYIGFLAGNLANIGIQNGTTNPLAQWTFKIIGFIATVGVTLYITHIAKKALNETVEKFNQ